MAKGAVWSLPVVVLQPRPQGSASVPVVLIGGGVSPLGLQGLDEALRFAVGAGPVGPGAKAPDAELGGVESDPGGAGAGGRETSGGGIEADE